MAQPEVARRRFAGSEDSAPSGRGFSRHEDPSSDACFWMLNARGSTPALIRIGSIALCRRTVL
jgi:hypothetical protein